MSESARESEQVPLTGTLSADLLSAMAATIGLKLSAERAAALATQAEPHFALLRALDDIAHPSTEPAAEFHLDAWRSALDG
jgi:hypothetical protein